MTQEDNELLLIDLSARLHHGVIVQQSAMYANEHFADKWQTEPHNFNIIGIIGKNTLVTDKSTTERTYMKGIVSKPVTICIYDELTKQTARPYLRPLSSMTEEEKKEYTSLCNRQDIDTPTWSKIIWHDTYKSIDWLNKKMFDYRKDDKGKTMIEKGLALEAPEGMYEKKKS